ncbi:MAG TPA: hypothetical protein VIL99_14300 [Ignavibacteria bacterium]
MGNKTNYNLLHDVYNKFDVELAQYKENVENIYKKFIDGLVEFLGCDKGNVGYTDEDNIAN